MTARMRVLEARRVLTAAVAGRAFALAAAAGVGGLGLAAWIDRMAPLPLAARRLALPLAILLGAVVLVALLRAVRAARGLHRVALFVEERVPALEFALVTALDGHGPAAAALERRVADVYPAGVLRAPVLRSAGTSLAWLVLGAGLFALAPASAVERVLHPRAGDVLLSSRGVPPASSRVASIAAEITPPAYARRAVERSENPVSLRGLVGSRLLIRGRGAAAAPAGSLTAALGGEPVPVAFAADTWSVALTMPDKPAALRLGDRGYDRLVTLEPVADLAPTVALLSPARDTTYNLPKGQILLDGTARDDIGLAHAEFELMHTTGSGERFDVRRFTLAAVNPGGAASVALRAAIVLDTMHLGPGDVLHVRLVARDENTVTGPGEGTSDTRTIRIADPSQRDTVVVVPVALAQMDTTLLSQRVLIQRAETLWARRKRMPADTFELRAHTLGDLQAQLRSRVEQVIDDLETITDVGFMGKTPTSIILREAASAMRQAEKLFIIPDVQGAIPPMYRALKALERARTSDRLYLRGVFPKIVVDLDKIRLKGTDKPDVSSRQPRPAEADPRRSLLERLDRAAAAVLTAPDKAADSLTLIRVEALTQAPDAAAPLARAIEGLRANKDTRAAFEDARRRLLRETEATPALPGWRGAP